MEMNKFLYSRYDKEKEGDEIKALVNSGTDLIETDDTLADKIYASRQRLRFLFSYLAFK